MRKLLLLTGLILVTLTVQAQNNIRVNGIVPHNYDVGTLVSVCTQTSITSASEIGNVVTIGTTLAPLVGDTVVITGVVPVAYNGTVTVTKTGPTKFSFISAQSNLGAGTSFGTVVDLPCTNPVPLCISTSDASCTAPNPVVSDANSNYAFYVQSGQCTASAPCALQFYGLGLPYTNLADQAFIGGTGTGTITGVTASTGLTGGGSSGSVSLAVINPIPTGVVVGSAVVSNGSSQAPVYQTKPIIDVRDGFGGSGGVDCTRTTDSTTALNNMIANAPNFSAFIIPYGCQIKITSTISVLQKFGMRFDFQQEADTSTFNAAGLFWYGAQHGTMLYLNQVHGSVWHGLSLNCSGTNTGFAPGTIGCDVAMLLDEPSVPSNITTNNSFFDLQIFNQAANPAFVGVDVGPNAPGNVENNYFWNAKVFCAGPASGNTDTGFRIGSAGGGSQPNNTQFSHGGPTNCGRGWWIRGNTAGVDISNMTFGGNFNSLYLAGGDQIKYDTVVDQVSTTPIVFAANGIHLTLDNYNTSGTVTSEISINTTGWVEYLTMRNSKFTAPLTLSFTGTSGAQLWDFNTTGQDSTFCTVVNASRQYDTYSNTCRLMPLGLKERANLNGGNAGYDEFWPDSTAHRLKMNNNAGGATSVAGLSDFASPPAIGNTTPAAGSFTTVTSTVSTGTAPLTVSSTTNVANLNASSLNGATFAAPGAIGGTTPAAGTFTALSGTSLSVNGVSIGNILTNTSAVTASNPTANTDTALMEIALPTNYLNTLGQPFSIYAGGVLTTTTASVPQVTITAKLCSVSGCGSGTVTPLAAIQSTALNTTAVTNASWSYKIAGVTTATGVSCNFIIKGDPGLAIELGSATTIADSIFLDSNTAVSSPNQNCANALFLDFFVQQSQTGASNSYKQQVGIIR